MTEEAFVRRRKDSWDRYQHALREISRHKTSSMTQEFPSLYRRLCQDLNQAKAEVFSLALVQRLNHLVWEGHQKIYRNAKPPAKGLRILFEDFPASVRREWKAVLWAHLLFYGIGVLAFFYTLSYPDSWDGLLGLAQKEALAEMYDPESEHFLKPREVTQSADMFGFYIHHNISIGFQTFAGGALAGVGSLFFLVYNGLFMGITSAWMVGWSFENTFFPFVVTHSAFELTALILFGVCGLKLGWSLLAPGPLKRGTSFAREASRLLPLLWGSVLFLVIAAGIEAFWSSLTLAPAIKFVSGAASWTLVTVFLLWGGRKAHG